MKRKTFVNLSTLLSVVISIAVAVVIWLLVKYANDAGFIGSNSFAYMLWE